ncbi:unnamed protein product [Somion occarium]
MHFCRLFSGDELSVSLARHEHYLCGKLRLKPGMTVLHIGSGTGTIAVELVRFSNVKVVGVETDREKIMSAIARAEQLHMSDRLSFIKVDSYSELSSMLPSESFDIVYAVESLRHAPSFSDVYSEMCRMLKPGGKLGIYEWCWSAMFDPSDPEHGRFTEVFEATIGLPQRDPNGRSIAAAITAIELCGMQVLLHEDLAEKQNYIPWYSILEKALSDPFQSSDEAFGQQFFSLSRSAAYLLIQSAKSKLFTPMALFVAQRPME